MYVGVKRAGYFVTDEASIVLVVLALPAATVLFAWWKLR
jgi:hypothetical protein